MAQFVRLTDRHGGTQVIMQVEQMSSIRDLRSDKAIINMPEWHYTIIVCGGRTYEVMETASEILEKIESVGQPEHKDEKRREKRDRLLEETIVMLATDLYQTIYESDDCTGWGDACDLIIGYAEQFERELDWQVDDDRDYIVELDKFEKKVLDELNKE